VYRRRRDLEIVTCLEHGGLRRLGLQVKRICDKLEDRVPVCGCRSLHRSRAVELKGEERDKERWGKKKDGVFGLDIDR